MTGPGGPGEGGGESGAKRIALAALFLSMLLVAAAYGAVLLSGAVPRWSPWAVALGTPTAMVATMVLGAVRPGRPNGGLGLLAGPLLITLAVTIAAFAAAFVLPATDEPIVLGLPRRAAIILYGVGFLPVFILPVVYALTFRVMALDDSDLERLRAATQDGGEQTAESERGASSE